MTFIEAPITHGAVSCHTIDVNSCSLGDDSSFDQIDAAVDQASANPLQTSACHASINTVTDDEYCLRVTSSVDLSVSSSEDVLVTGKNTYADGGLQVFSGAHGLSVPVNALCQVDMQCESGAQEGSVSLYMDDSLVESEVVPGTEGDFFISTTIAVIKGSTVYAKGINTAVKSMSVFVIKAGIAIPRLVLTHATLSHERLLPFVDPLFTALETSVDGVETNVSSSVQTTGTVNVDINGIYYLRYKLVASDGVITVRQTRKVTVVDTTAPIITRVGEGAVSLQRHDSYVDAGATAVDGNGGEVLPVQTFFLSPANNTSSSLDNTVTGLHKAIYQCVDLSGNIAVQVERNIQIVDSIAPQITLNGAAEVTIERENTYVDLGATAYDLDSAGSAREELTPSIAVTPLAVSFHHDQNFIVRAFEGKFEFDVPASFSLTEKLRCPQLTLTAATTYTFDTSHNTNDTHPFVILQNGAVISTTNGTTVTVTTPEAGQAISYACSNHANMGNSIEIASEVSTNNVGAWKLFHNVSDQSGNPASQVTRTLIVKDGVKPQISLVSPDTIVLERVTGNYTEPGYTASDGSVDLTANVVVSSDLNTSLSGTYTVTYSVSDSSGNVSQKSRSVQVQDTTPPIITVIGGDISVNKYDTWLDPGATALDDGDTVTTTTALPRDVSGNEVSVDDMMLNLGTYTIAYSAVDVAGNPATATRVVTVVDITGPVVTVQPSLTLEVGASYTELVATAVDGGSSVPVIVGGDTVDTTTPGVYTRSFTATDAVGNTTVVNRTITVVDSTDPVIALKGHDTIRHWIDTPYTDLGTTSSDQSSSALTIAVVYTNSIPTITNATEMVSTAGVYTVTYTASDSSGNSASVYRTVIVDDQDPVITLYDTSDIAIAPGEFFDYAAFAATRTDLGFFASNATGETDLSSLVVVTDNIDFDTGGADYFITYELSSAVYGPGVQVVRKVTVQSSEPRITEAFVINSVLESDWHRDEYMPDVFRHKNAPTYSPLTYTLLWYFTGNTTSTKPYLSRRALGFNFENPSNDTGVDPRTHLSLEGHYLTLADLQLSADGMTITNLDQDAFYAQIGGHYDGAFLAIKFDMEIQSITLFADGIYTSTSEKHQGMGVRFSDDGKVWYSPPVYNEGTDDTFNTDGSNTQFAAAHNLGAGSPIYRYPLGVDVYARKSSRYFFFTCRHKIHTLRLNPFVHDKFNFIDAKLFYTKSRDGSTDFPNASNWQDITTYDFHNPPTTYGPIGASEASVDGYLTLAHSFPGFKFQQITHAQGFETGPTREGRTLSLNTESSNSGMNINEFLFHSYALRFSEEASGVWIQNCYDRQSKLIAIMFSNDGVSWYNAGLPYAKNNYRAVGGPNSETPIYFDGEIHRQQNQREDILGNLFRNSDEIALCRPGARYVLVLGKPVANGPKLNTLNVIISLVRSLPVTVSKVDLRCHYNEHSVFAKNMVDLSGNGRSVVLRNASQIPDFAGTSLFVSYKTTLSLYDYGTQRNHVNTTNNWVHPGPHGKYNIPGYAGAPFGDFYYVQADWHTAVDVGGFSTSDLWDSDQDWTIVYICQRAWAAPRTTATTWLPSGSYSGSTLISAIDASDNIVGHFGFKDGRTGYSQIGNATTHPTKVPAQENPAPWLFAIERPGVSSFMLESEWHFTDYTYTPEAGIKFRPCINKSRDTPWNLAELVLYDRTLSDLEVGEMKEWMQSIRREGLHESFHAVSAPPAPPPAPPPPAPSFIAEAVSHFRQGDWVLTDNMTGVWYNSGTGGVAATLYNSAVHPHYFEDGYSASGVRELQGTESSKISFGTVPDDFTICSATRYRDGGRKHRVLTSSQHDRHWYHGHNGGKRGVVDYRSGGNSHYLKTLDETTVTNDEYDWLIMCATNSASSNLVLANGQDVGTRAGGSSPVELTINDIQWPSVRSKFAVAEVIIWNRALTDDELHEASAYLTSVLDGARPV